MSTNFIQTLIWLPSLVAFGEGFTPACCIYQYSGQLFKTLSCKNVSKSGQRYNISVSPVDVSVGSIRKKTQRPPTSALNHFSIFSPHPALHLHSPGVEVTPRAIKTPLEPLFSLVFAFGSHASISRHLIARIKKIRGGKKQGLGERCQAPHDGGINVLISRASVPAFT